VHLYVKWIVMLKCRNSPSGSFGHLNAASGSACARSWCLTLTLPRYSFLNIVKYNVHNFFVVISLICMQASPLRHVTKSRLCAVLLEAPANAQSDITFLALCVDASLPTCRRNTAVHSLGGRGWPVMSRRNIVNDRAGSRPNGRGRGGGGRSDTF
jgi:hypothetical protein